MNLTAFCLIRGSQSIRTSLSRGLSHQPLKLPDLPSQPARGTSISTCARIRTSNSTFSREKQQERISTNQNPARTSTSTSACASTFNFRIHFKPNCHIQHAHSTIHIGSLRVPYFKTEAGIPSKTDSCTQSAFSSLEPFSRAASNSARSKGFFK